MRLAAWRVRRAMSRRMPPNRSWPTRRRIPCRRWPSPQPQGRCCMRQSRCCRVHEIESMAGRRAPLGISGSTELQQGKGMSFIAWIVLGLIAGFVASKIVNKSGEGVLLDIILGVVGAVLGGYLFQTFGMAGVTGLNIYSLLVAVLGAVVLLWVYHLLIRRRA